MSCSSRINGHGINGVHSMSYAAVNRRYTVTAPWRCLLDRAESTAAVRSLTASVNATTTCSLGDRVRLLAAQLANRIRNWRANYHLDSLDEAFAQHREFLPSPLLFLPPPCPAQQLRASQSASPQSGNLTSL